jgi:hypothetical protein
MAKFEIGDKVQMPGIPFVVTVLEIGTCEEGENCPFGLETFRFQDPDGHGNDWAHTSKFEAVQ